MTTRNGSSALGEPSQLVALLHDQHRGPDDDGELAELRRLERAAEEEAARAVDARRDALGKDETEQQRGDRDPHDRPRPRRNCSASNLAASAKATIADADARELTGDVERSCPVALHRDDRARAVQHGQAEGDQHRHDEHEAARLGPMRQRSRTCAAETAPRASARRSRSIDVDPPSAAASCLNIAATLLVVVEHVVAGTGGRQQHRVARPRECARAREHLVERRSEPLDRHDTGEVRLDDAAPLRRRRSRRDRCDAARRRARCTALPCAARRAAGPSASACRAARRACTRRWWTWSR